MDFELLKTQFGKHDLLYVPSEQMLYVWNRNRNGIDEFVCYQTVLADKKKKDHSSHKECFSRVRCLLNGKCERMNVFVPHTEHDSHRIYYEDKMKMAAMKEKCQFLASNFPEAAHRIPNRHIYQREIAK